MSKKTVTPPDHRSLARNLARDLVDYRLGDLTGGMDFFLGEGGDLTEVGSRFKALVDLLADKEWGRAEEVAEFRARLAERSNPLVVVEACAREAGFLVGLELGRRVGGVR